MIRTLQEYKRVKKSLRLDELKKICADLDLPTSGTKSDLHSRINSFFRESKKLNAISKPFDIPQRVQQRILKAVEPHKNLHKELIESKLNPELLVATLLSVDREKMNELSALHPRIKAEADSEYVNQLLIVKHVPNGIHIVRRGKTHNGQTYLTWKDMFQKLVENK